MTIQAANVSPAANAAEAAGAAHLSQFISFAIGDD
jgi:hypothetical protein